MTLRDIFASRHEYVGRELRNAFQSYGAATGACLVAPGDVSPAVDFIPVSRGLVGSCLTTRGRMLAGLGVQRSLVVSSKMSLAPLWRSEEADRGRQLQPHAAHPANPLGETNAACPPRVRCTACFSGARSALFSCPCRAAFPVPARAFASM